MLPDPRNCAKFSDGAGLGASQDGCSGAGTTGYHFRTGYSAIWRTDNSPEHYAEAERLLALADRHTRGVTYDQEWTLTMTAAQVHAALALAAATAVGTAGPDGHAWAEVAVTRLSARKQEPASESSPGPDPLLRRPPPLFPPEDGSRH